MNKAFKEWCDLLAEKEAEGMKEAMLEDDKEKERNAKNAMLKKRLDKIK